MVVVFSRNRQKANVAEVWRARLSDGEKRLRMQIGAKHRLVGHGKNFEKNNGKRRNNLGHRLDLS